jgi:hypothetical protein
MIDERRAYANVSKSGSESVRENESNGGRGKFAREGRKGPCRENESERSEYGI